MDDTLTNDPIDLRRAELTYRIKELLDVPHVGKLARKLRKRAGLSLEDLGYLIDVAPEDIKEAEKTEDRPSAKSGPGRDYAHHGFRR